jgi:uncharacterized protein with HEPN domain
MKRLPADLLRDAREMAWHASAYSSLQPETLADAKDARFSVVYCLIIIGEAFNNISAPVRGLAPDIPWKAIVDMRHVLIHAYWRTDYTILHEVVSRDLEPLISQIDQLLPQVDKGDS